MQYIKKRAGRLVQFNKNKIVDAITSAFKDADGEVTSYAIEKAKFNSLYGMSVTNNIKDTVIFDNELGKYVAEWD